MNQEIYNPSKSEIFRPIPDAILRHRLRRRKPAFEITTALVRLDFRAVNSIPPKNQCAFMECLRRYIHQPIFSTCFELTDFDHSDSDSDSAAYMGPRTTIPVPDTKSGRAGQWIHEGVRFGVEPSVSEPGNDEHRLRYWLSSSLTLPAEVAKNHFKACFRLVVLVRNPGPYRVDAELPHTLTWSLLMSPTGSGKWPPSLACRSHLKNDGPDAQYCWTMDQPFSHDIANAELPFHISKCMVWGNQAGTSLALANQARF